MASLPVTKVELSVSCTNLQDRDAMSKSDPMCVLSVEPFQGNTFMEYGRSDMVKNSLNPNFAKKFIIDYSFETVQKLKFEIYDVDSDSAKLSKQDFLGAMECTLGEIVGSPASKLSKRLIGKSGHSYIAVMAEELSACKEQATLQFRAEHLDKKDTFGKSDPFLMFYRANPDGSWTLFHRSEYIKNTLKPTWKPFAISVNTFCNGDYDRVIKIECYDYDSDGSSHDIIGGFQTTLKQLTQGPGGSNTYECINAAKKQSKKGYKNSGQVYLMSCKIDQVYSFLDYIRGGTQLHFTVAIDFTGSNGNPREPASLHFMSGDPYRPNQYVQAIQAVGAIIQDYDSDKLFPALGFGAKLPNGQVSHEFFVNLRPDNPYCQGVAGILQAYQYCLQSVQLYGPTNFSPVINHVARIAHSSQDGSQYFVLLIITDGIITDMVQTKEAIVQASNLPMSIIIIGVGEADFSGMDELDSDRQPLVSASGQRAVRDIVQFVPYRDYQSQAAASNQSPGIIQARLAKDVLAEVPNQLVSFMKSRNIKPREPQPMPPQQPPT